MSLRNIKQKLFHDNFDICITRYILLLRSLIQRLVVTLTKSALNSEICCHAKIVTQVKVEPGSTIVWSLGLLKYLL